jgi:hypothetical protein
MSRDRFNPDRGIKNTADRAAANDAIRRTDTFPKDMRDAMIRMNTPPALRHLPDGGIRGHKSLGRIQQINNRRRFKVRTTASR